MSTQLLTIETSFLSMTHVKEGLHLGEVTRIQRSITNAQKKKFDQTIQMSTFVAKGFEWFGSLEGKGTMSEVGLSWSVEDFALKVYGWKKSYFYKVVKAGKLDNAIVTSFIEKCDSIGEEANRTLEGLLKFAKQSQSSEGGEGEGEGGEGAEVGTNPKAIITFAWKKADGSNVACRIMSDGTLKTSNGKEELIGGIHTLLNHIRINMDGATQDDAMQDYEDRLEFVMGEDCEEDSE